MSAAIENPLPVTGESKSARKKKAKAEAANANGTAVPETPAKESSEAQENGSYEHPHLRELQKQMRNINKRLTGLAKTDAVIAENPGVSLEDLVSQKKINTDQKAAAEKKPGLQTQMQQAEEQVKVFRGVDADYQAQISKLKEDLTSQHQKEMEKVKEEMQTEATSTSSSELRKKLLVFSQFLRTAAAKRNVEDNSDPVENEAFEGALLLAYGGDEKAVDTAVAIIEGTDEQVPNIEGTLLEIKYSQIRKVSSENTPFQTEEAWVDSVAEANAAVESQQAAQSDEPAAQDAQSAEDATAATASDPTLVNAGLTELDAPQANGVQAAEQETITSPANASAGNEAGNLAGDRWDTGAGATQDSLDEGYEMIPRPNDEVDTPAPAPAAGVPAVESMLRDEKTSWADEATAASGQDAVSGNVAGEAWDTKPAGQTEDSIPAASTNGSADTPAAETTDAAPAAGDDGFQEIPSRPHAGRGRGRGNGEFRGRGGYRGRGGPRGDGEGRGGRGGRGGYRGDRGRGGEGGESRGRGGRGRGPRGDSAAQCG